jgi:hypothetical protein
LRELRNNSALQFRLLSEGEFFLLNHEFYRTADFCEFEHYEQGGPGNQDDEAPHLAGCVVDIIETVSTDRRLLEAPQLPELPNG